MHRHLKPGGVIILTTPYHGYLKNLALSLLNAWDKHFTVDWEGGHIKFFSPKTLSAMLKEAGFGEIEFRGAGRLPYLWKTGVYRAVRLE
jgi:2-polyprenyl-6-hydroxyphenyl methylase/3-demethylubiquinone-9 3-methyltransferase